MINLCIVTLNFGFRLGETLGLCWDKVDFESNQVVVSRTLTRNGLQNTTKGGETRYLPMNDNVRTALKNELKKEIKGQFVFSQPNGAALPYDHLTQRHFLQAQKRAKLTKRIRFHDLRHTFASHFMMNGGQIYTLQRLLGHKDIKTTMIYAHLDREFMRSASEVVKF